MEWKKVKLGEVLNFRRGHDLPHEQMTGGDIPVAGSNGIIGYHNIASPIEPILTIGRSGNVGTPYLYKRAWAHNTTLYVDDFKGNDPTFLYYLCKTLPFASFKGGSAVPTLNRNHIHPLEVRFPTSISDQRRIAAILSSLDAQIENNNRINANLEAQAQALFKSWFVDFEPWGGVMPEDWKEYELDVLVDNISGYSYKGDELQSSNMAMATIKNFLRGGGFKEDGFKEIVLSKKIKSEQFVKLFDILVAHTDLTQNADVIGNPAIILSTGGYDSLIMSMDLTKVVPKDNRISQGLMYCILNDRRFKEHALGYVNGTTVLHMSKKAVPAYHVFLPSDFDKLKEIGDVLDYFFMQIANNHKASARLAALRDTLLPKLMKGEIEL